MEQFDRDIMQTKALILHSAAYKADANPEMILSILSKLCKLAAPRCIGQCRSGCQKAGQSIDIKYDMRFGEDTHTMYLDGLLPVFSTHDEIHIDLGNFEDMGNNLTKFTEGEFAEKGPLSDDCFKEFSEKLGLSGNKPIKEFNKDGRHPYVKKGLAMIAGVIYANSIPKASMRLLKKLDECQHALIDTMRRSYKGARTSLFLEQMQNELVNEKDSTEAKDAVYNTLRMNCMKEGNYRVILELGNFMKRYAKSKKVELPNIKKFGDFAQLNFDSVPEGVPSLKKSGFTEAKETEITNGVTSYVTKYNNAVTKLSEENATEDKFASVVEATKEAQTLRKLLIEFAGAKTFDTNIP